MNFNKVKTLASALMGATILATPAFANTGLQIVNATHNTLSFVINESCSTEFGAIDSHSNKTISEADFHKACKLNQHFCMAKIYATADCSGNRVAALAFDSDIGVKEVLDSGSYAYTWAPNKLWIGDRL